MTMVGCRCVDEYFGRLTVDPEEIERLVDAVTIHVTGFFRDRDVFDALESEHVPALVARKASGGLGALRVWSAGCSTGEETYSIAMMLERALRDAGGNGGEGIEVFGTDVSASACRAAMAGVFDNDRMTGLPAVLKNRYFRREGGSWRIGRELRAFVKFKAHDLFSPPPYSMLDMIFCRNVLIHFEHRSRVAVMRHFHAALAEWGLLVLGKSEALCSTTGALFELVEPRFKIYTKRTVGSLSGEDR